MPDRNMPRIVSAAIRYIFKDGTEHIATGRRHAEIREDFVMERKSLGKPMPVESFDGFMTDAGEFLEREAAMDVARAAGQLRFQTARRTLNSEDLW